MNRRYFQPLWALAFLALASLLAGPALAADEAAEALIKRLSTEVLDTIRADKAIQAGDVNRIITLVDTKIMPNVNFQRMTASAVGPGWRQATPEQQKRLQEEFKTLLVRTYAGALTQVSDQTIVVKPMRAAADDKEVVVRIEGTNAPLGRKMLAESGLELTAAADLTDAAKKVVAAARAAAQR